MNGSLLGRIGSATEAGIGVMTEMCLQSIAFVSKSKQGHDPAIIRCPTTESSRD